MKLLLAITGNTLRDQKRSSEAQKECNFKVWSDGRVHKNFFEMNASLDFRMKKNNLLKIARNRISTSRSPSGRHSKR